MNEPKLFFCDLETAGINPYKSAILEIGCVIHANGHREEFRTFVKPFPDDEINEKALTVNKIRRADFEGFPEPEDVYAKLIGILSRYINKYEKTDKFFFIGYNAIGFDFPFLRKFFEKNGDRFFGSYFFFPALDVMAMAGFHLMDVRHEMVNFKLTTVARELGIKVDDSKAHAALYDIILTELMYEKMKGGLK
jgi:DNA polymerase-3 subunit epsilon